MIPIYLNAQTVLIVYRFFITGLDYLKILIFSVLKQRFKKS